MVVHFFWTQCQGCHWTLLYHVMVVSMVLLQLPVWYCRHNPSHLVTQHLPVTCEFLQFLVHVLLLLFPSSWAEYCDQFVCLCVCLSMSISLQPLDRSSRSFLCRSPVVVAQSSDGVAICYVLPVLWMMLCLAVMGCMTMCGRLNILPTTTSRVWCLWVPCYSHMPIGILGIYCLLFVCHFVVLSVRRIFGNGCLGRGLT